MAAQYSEDLASRAQAWLAHSDSKRRTRENLAELHQVFALITGGSAAGCTNCNFSGYVGILEAYVRQSTSFFHPETMSASKYTIANGLENEEFVQEGYNKVVTAENLTDEDAEYFRKHGYEHAFVLKPDAAAAEKEAAAKQKAADKAQKEANKAKEAADKKAAAEKAAADKKAAAEASAKEKAEKEAADKATAEKAAQEQASA